MQAIVQREYGGAEVLKQATAAIPSITEHEVLIEVHAGAVDRGTSYMMTGTPYLIRIMGFGLMRPQQPTPGLDVAGRVVEVGPAVVRFAPGDEVFGIASSGSFAEFVAAREDRLTHKPRGLSFEAAAAATVSGITALEALTDVGSSSKDNTF